MRLYWVLLILPMLGTMACGYQAVRVSEALDSGNRIALHGFRNDSLEAGVDSVLTEAISREVMQRGALRLVDEPSAADWIMTGTISRLDVNHRSFSSVSFSLEYEVLIELDIVLQHRDGRRFALDSRALQGRERYLASADVEVTRTNREEAIRRIASQLAVRIHDAFYEQATLRELESPEP